MTCLIFERIHEMIPRRHQMYVYILAVNYHIKLAFQFTISTFQSVHFSGEA